MSLLLLSTYLGVILLVVGLASLWVSVNLGFSGLSLFIEWDMFMNYSFSFVFTLLGDWVSLSFIGLVMVISGAVLVYSGEYMSHDSSFYRFIILVVLFVASMIFMVMSPNLVSILLGWDGLGLVSYGLVIYYQNMSSVNAGMLTILSNRVGDVAILLSIAWVFDYGSWDMSGVQNLGYSHLWLVVGLVGLAALTKSAQVPFSAWLPAAMAAPTPVSSLVHSSTLVTAGVFLLVRFSEALGVSYVLFIISLLTMTLSGVGAVYEMDLKSVIALSTLSQLGVMMMSLSLGLVDLAYFHLLTHAMFKSLLFLSAGVFIHGSLDNQDVRVVGGVGCLAPLTSSYFLGCSLALVGFPFLAGFYSKDLILELYFGVELVIFLFVLVGVTTFFTMVYSWRLATLLLMSPLKVLSLSGMEVVTMSLPMSILFFLAGSGGSLLGWLWFPIYEIILPIWLKIMVTGVLVFYLVYSVGFHGVSVAGLKRKNLAPNWVFSFLGGMWWLGVLSVKWGRLFKSGSAVLKMVDQGWFEKFGPQGVFFVVSLYSVYLDYSGFFSVKKIIFFMFFLFVNLVILVSEL